MSRPWISETANFRLQPLQKTRLFAIFAIFHASCLHFIWGVGDGQPLGHLRLDCDLRQVVWVAQLCGEVELEVLPGKSSAQLQGLEEFSPVRSWFMNKY